MAGSVKLTHNLFSDLTSSGNKINTRGGARAGSTSKIERFVIITKHKVTILCDYHSILDFAAPLDPPLNTLIPNVKWIMYSKVEDLKTQSKDAFIFERTYNFSYLVDTRRRFNIDVL